MPIIAPNPPSLTPLLQAPVVLSTGAIARYPLQRKLSFATRKIEFADFSRQTFPQIYPELGRWDLNMQLMQDSEVADWRNLWEATLAGDYPFSFIDPASNLLAYSEALENAVWENFSGNMVVGQNYLLNSQDFSQSSWLPGGETSSPVVTPNSQIAPDGRMTASAIAFPAVPTGEFAAITQNGTGIPGTPSMTLTFSLWMRVASGTGTINIEVSDNVSQSTTVVCNLTSSWQRFSASISFNSTPGPNVSVQIISPQNSAALTVWAWGAQLEYGPIPSDYSVTTATTSILQIADPFFVQAPSSVSGYQWNLNSAMPRRGRQIVCLSANSTFGQQVIPLLVSAAGNSRRNGLTLGFSCWFRGAFIGLTNYSPAVTFSAGDIEGYEAASIATTPSLAWVRFFAAKQFSASNPSVAGTVAQFICPTVGTFYIFGAQLETEAVASGYKLTGIRGGFRPKCYFATDDFSHTQSEFNVSSLQLSIEESN